MLTEANTRLHACTISISSIQKHREHASEMVETAVATSGLLYKDKTHRGKEARTYPRSSSLFFATIINRVFTVQMRLCEPH